MHLSRISVYQILIPFKPLGSKWVGRRKPSHLDSTVVALETDTGLTGYGESCPIAAVYLPAFAGGLRAAIEEMAPALLGQDPIKVDGIYLAMDAALYGHGYAKAAVDIACWDLLGKATGQPISTLLGGRFMDAVPAYASIPINTPENMVETLKQKLSEGFGRFQVKIGDDPMEDVARAKALVDAAEPGTILMMDANRGWSRADAIRAVAGLNELDCHVEQPCMTYEEGLAVRERCMRPMILDEVIDGPRDLARAIADEALDGLVIKVTHAGGLTPARLERDMCIRNGIQMRLEDTAGTEITRAAQAHLAAATPIDLQLGSYSFLNDMPPAAEGAPELRDGHLHLNDEPGLGIAPNMDVLGDPVAVYG